MNSASMRSSAVVSLASTYALLQPPQHQRPEAVRVAHRDQLVLGEEQQAVGALHLAQRLHHLLLEASAARERAMRWMMTSVSESDWKMAPSRLELVRAAPAAFTRLPLCATASCPPA